MLDKLYKGFYCCNIWSFCTTHVSDTFLAFLGVRLAFFTGASLVLPGSIDFFLETLRFLVGFFVVLSESDCVDDDTVTLEVSEGLCCSVSLTVQDVPPHCKVHDIFFKIPKHPDGMSSSSLM